MSLNHFMLTVLQAKGSLASLGFAYLQQDSINSGNSKLLEVMVVIMAISFAVIALISVVFAIVGIKVKNDLVQDIAEVKGNLMPLLEKSHGLVKDLTPEIKEITVKVNLITAHVEKIAGIAREKAHEISPTISQANSTVQEALGKAREAVAEANQTVQGANQKTRQQIDRVNVMVTGALDATTRLGKAIEYGITQPGRELAGLISGAKAAMDSLLHHSSGLKKDTVGTLTSIFAKKRPGYTSPARPAPAYRNNPAPANVKPFGSMSTLEAGVSSGSTGNGDPIL